MQPFLKERLHPKNFIRDKLFPNLPHCPNGLFFFRRFFFLPEKKKRQKKSPQ
jgi:hypothetical protein